MRKFRPIKLKPDSFYQSAKHFNRSDYRKEYYRLHAALRRRVENMEGYYVPKSYKNILDKYVKGMSNDELFKEVRHLRNILRKQHKFDLEYLEARKQSQLEQFKTFGITEENYQQFWSFLDAVSDILKESQYDSSEAMQYFNNNISDMNTDELESIDYNKVAREFMVYLATQE